MKQVNPSVPQVVELNGKFIKLAIFEIGAWNMVADHIIQRPHSLDITKVVSIDVIISNDAQDEIYNFQVTGATWESSGWVGMYTTEFELQRKPGGLFDSADFNGVAINRGYITVQYYD